MLRIDAGVDDSDGDTGTLGQFVGFVDAEGVEVPLPITYLISRRCARDHDGGE